MSEPHVMAAPISANEQANPFFAEFGKMITEPYIPPEQAKAQAEAAEAERERIEQETRARYKAEFDRTPAGIRLQQERDDKYIKGAFNKLMEAMQNNDPWYYELMADMTHYIYAEDERYQALQQYYDMLLKDYIRSRTGH